MAVVRVRYPCFLTNLQARRWLGEDYGFGVDKGVGSSHVSPLVIRFARGGSNTASW